ncbi:MAG: chorismate mutase [Clostridiales bacterium]|nr:chorismate mutase [Clostridiales bacterium]
MDMKELEDIRQELDAVDRRIVALFEQRMALARDVAAYKMAHGMQVLDRSREEAVLASRVDMLRDGHWAGSVRALYEEIMRLSRAEQERILKEAESHA